MAVSICQRPLRMEENRVWRVYSGGALIDRMKGEPQKDGAFPEEWVNSVTRADNPGRVDEFPDEGLSFTVAGGGRAALKDLVAQDPAGMLGEAHVDVFGPTAALLAKFLDSSVRLPVQAHPDKRFARDVLHSDYGKTESWLILDTRSVGEDEPYVLMGFREGVTMERFADAVRSEESARLACLLHRIPVEPGDGYIIPGGLPHAIGPGVFMVEVQEPTDLVCQPERFCGEQRLEDESMWHGLEPDVALGMFHYDGCATPEDVRARYLIPPREVFSGPGGTVREVVGEKETSCFSALRVEVTGELRAHTGGTFYSLMCVGGSGTLDAPSRGVAPTATEETRNPQREEIPVSAGDILFVPAATPAHSFRSSAGMSLIIALPPGAEGVGRVTFG